MARSSPNPSPADQWLLTGQAPPERVVDVARALALLSGEVPLAPAVLSEPLGADLELAVLKEAEARGMYELVLLLRDHGKGRGVGKAARRVLYRARQRGVELPERPVERAAVSLAPRPDPLPSYCSGYGGDGGQIVAYGGWSETDGPFALLAILSDRRGLQSVAFMAGLSRTRLREFVQEIERSMMGAVVEVDGRFSLGRIRWSLDVADRLGQAPKGDLAVARRLVQGVDPIVDIELNLDPADEARVSERIAAGDELAQEACFFDWKPVDEMQVDDVLQRFQDREVDPDLPDEALFPELRRVLTAYMRETMDEAVRHRLAARLELNAWLFARQGKRERALRAISTARGLRDPKREALDLPFVRYLFERDLPFAALAGLYRSRSQVPGRPGGK